MSFNIINRRLHLYLGLLLMLFFMKYGISAILFSHNKFFNEYYKDKPQWTERFNILYYRPVPEEGDIREFASQVLKDLDMEGTFWANRQNKRRINFNRFSFWSSTRFTYLVDKKRLIAEDKVFRWDHFLQKFHWIGGYHQNRFINDAWAFFLDMVFLSVIFWVFSGIYMWWQIRGARFWGSIALCGGFVSFIIITFLL